ncbi:hypothetical protein GDO81_015069 [Engystomops pustulosus]|uniref:C2H2-type domain-containing protein n=1 Tax=Engystomops pustulosus TaxID=76066 RepID=A0AAV7AMM7_ENGPU|nr:hypothetical protein GDO81_015069 [Engystomops pustulosus]KAG8560660.1 hypothetical protein GDO81_015069 [Engystomops pustulosus]
MPSIPEKMLRSQQYRNHMKAPRRRPYCCDTCLKQFETPSKLARHCLSHTGQKPFPCPDCGKTFRQLVHLERHAVTHTLPFECNICHRHFKNSETFTKHQKLHRPKPVKEVRSKKSSRRSVFSLPLHCFGCQKTFLSEEKRLHHRCNFMNVRAVRIPQSWGCDLCDKVFPTRSKLERHLMSHTDQRPFACALCGKAFRQKTHLKIHQLTHSQEKPFQCAQCPKSFKLPEKLLRHQQTHTRPPKARNVEIHPKCEPLQVKQEADEGYTVVIIPFHCSSCGQYFEKQENLDNHHCLVQTPVTSTRTTYNSEIVTNTQVLGDEIPQDVPAPFGKLLKVEPVDESGQVDTMEEETQRLDVSKNLFQKKNGIGQMETQMKIEGYLQHQQLGMNFQGLLEHNNGVTIGGTYHTYDQRQHGVESHSLHQFLQGAQGVALRKVVKCDQCNKMFSTMSKLRRHYLIHTGQKPFTCGECRKTFRQSAHLKRHLVTHVQKVTALRSQDALDGYHSTFCQEPATNLTLSQHCYDATLKSEDKEIPILVPEIKVESESTDLSSVSQKQGTPKKSRVGVSHGRSAKCHRERPPRTPVVPKSYKCNECSKIFFTPSKLERHNLMHAGKKPFQCSECGKSFRQDPHLKRHMMTHDRVKK